MMVYEFPRMNLASLKQNLNALVVEVEVDSSHQGHNPLLRIWSLPSGCLYIYLLYLEIYGL